MIKTLSLAALKETHAFGSSLCDDDEQCNTSNMSGNPFYCNENTAILTVESHSNMWEVIDLKCYHWQLLKIVLHVGSKPSDKDEQCNSDNETGNSDSAIE